MERREPSMFLPATLKTQRKAAESVSPDYLVERLREVIDGRPVAAEVAVQLLRCDDEIFPNLLATARALKNQYRPGVITYSRKVFIPLTNLCRDYCGYCTYRRDPGEAGAHTMTPDEVLSVAKAGEKLGCTEALFSLGDRPEALFPEMRETLKRLGYRSTLHYLEAMCELVLRETRLLPHANPGLLSANWIERLRVSNPSLGLMLESTNTDLLAAHPAGQAPDKLPALRLRTIEDAGKLGVPFTTGILIGIGETMGDRVESLLAIKRLHEEYGHIQEVIIQNFRVKPRIAMAAWPEPDHGDMLRTLAVARLILRDMNIQAPPNLTESGYERLLEGGINDWGGVSPLTPDYINPEAPWPHLLDLQRRTEAAGEKLMQRLPVYPEFVPGVVARGGLLSDRLRELWAAGKAGPSGAEVCSG
jgi:FO synthase